MVRIASAVRAHAPALAGRDGTYFEAAVALILRETIDDDIELLFIKRAARDDDPWSGQIALPGGRHQDSDDSLEDTAVRETREEVGLELGATARSSARSTSCGRARPCCRRSSSGRTSRRLPRMRDRGERRGGRALLGAARRHPRSGGTARHGDRGAARCERVRPAIHFGGHMIWGMTERILRRFEEIIR